MQSVQEHDTSQPSECPFLHTSFDKHLKFNKCLKIYTIIYKKILVTYVSVVSLTGNFVQLTQLQQRSHRVHSQIGVHHDDRCIRDQCLMLDNLYEFVYYCLERAKHTSQMRAHQLRRNARMYVHVAQHQLRIAAAVQHDGEAPGASTGIGVNRWRLSLGQSALQECAVLVVADDADQMHVAVQLVQGFGYVAANAAAIRLTGGLVRGAVKLRANQLCIFRLVYNYS